MVAMATGPHGSEAVKPDDAVDDHADAAGASRHPAASASGSCTAERVPRDTAQAIAKRIGAACTTALADAAEYSMSHSGIAADMAASAGATGDRGARR